MKNHIDWNWYNGKKVLVTGHTGFKGSWLCKILLYFNAEVYGYGLEPPTDPSLYEIAGLEKVHSFIGDIRDFETLKAVFDKVQPEIVFHLAAQPLVMTSYKDPKYTYETNVMGTVNVLECVRLSKCVKSMVNITTDKVYENREWCWGYREDEKLDGHDPYSNSKSCSELVTHSYIKSYFADRQLAVSTARAGNVIGGGDFAENRIIPDCIRAACKKQEIEVRNPNSIRPYQHVLEPLRAYLMIAQRQYENYSYAGYYNIGPDECDCLTTGELVSMFAEHWGEGLTWKSNQIAQAPHEAHFLKLDSSKVKSEIGWIPKWHIEKAIEETVHFAKIWLENGNINREMIREIQHYFD